MCNATTLTTEVFTGADLEDIGLLPFLGGQVAYYTHRCPEKPTVNEDALGIFALSERQGVLVVADGCGGMQSGEVASATVVRQLKKTLAKLESLDSLRGAILDGLEKANQAILDLGSNSATTVMVVEIDNGRVRHIHAGDSQLLLVGGRGKVKLQTVAHSPVGYGVEAGLIDQHQAIEHEDRHLVSNIVGCETTHFEVGSPRKMAPRDTLLLASDGVFDNFLEGELPRLASKGNLEYAAREIIDAASNRMTGQLPDLPSKPDDIALVLFRQ